MLVLTCKLIKKHLNGAFFLYFKHFLTIHLNFSRNGPHNYPLTENNAILSTSTIFYICQTHNVTEYIGYSILNMSLSHVTTVGAKQ